jgi:hypothetical protein
MSDIFREIALRMAPKQAELINDFIKSAPIWASIPMSETSDGFKNVFERIISVEAMKKLTGLDSPLPSVNTESTLASVDLSVFGGLMEVGQDKANSFGSPADYFSKHLKTIMPYTAQSYEFATYYNELRPYAENLGNVIDAGGTTANKQTSLVVIRWAAGENTGLYNPQGFGSGKVFESFWMNGGNLYNIAKDGTTVPGYGMFFKNNFGLQLEGSEHCAAIVNIDLTLTDGEYTAMPTPDQIDDAIYSVRGTPANTMILTTNRMVGATRKFERAIGIAPPNEVMAISDWDGIPVIGSYNILDRAESVVTE